MSAVYEVKTSLNPEQLTEVAMETYRQWLQFALGNFSIGGKTLAHPSGRYAASLSWKKTGVASIAIIADENIAPEAQWIEDGTKGSPNFKDIMLGRYSKTSKDGYRYRIIPIRNEGFVPESPAVSIIENRLGGRVSKRNAKIWAENYSSGTQKFRVMTDAPGSAAWAIPPMVGMTPYSPSKTLSDLLHKQYGV